MPRRLIHLVDDIDKFVTAQRPVSDIKPLLALLREHAEALERKYVLPTPPQFAIESDNRAPADPH